MSSTSKSTKEAKVEDDPPTSSLMFQPLTNGMVEKMARAFPFPHLVVDQFVTDQQWVRTVEAEIRSIPDSVWQGKRDPTSNEMVFQQRKLAIKDRSCLGRETQRLIEMFGSPEACRYFSTLSGIPDLQADPSLLGGGVHRIDRGGKLSIHADFNLHPETQKHRRLNVLLYLNSDYKNEYQGQLQLWDKKMTYCASSIAPLLNRMVVFRITDDAFHGHPEPWLGPEDKSRLSLAFYYYTVTRPLEETAPFHWATWQRRPGKGF